MKLVHVETLISIGKFSASRQWKSVRAKLHRAIKAVDWPPGSKKFTIYPQSGKKRGEGNGVKPIKNECIKQLLTQGWTTETQFADEKHSTLGGLDATLVTRNGMIAMEWETGNVSSSHRALNKMALCLLRGQLAAATLVVPSRRLYRFLTDRIGNYSELEPYLDLWRSIPCTNGVLEIVVIEHDNESMSVPRIPKGTDGRSTN
ncbi:MAG: hypothetical protein IT422_03390 [Pirellulaceae bacterium]|jgi:hypothetical protein|nr:hypothetical protein [Pirellulaceae bacterium]